MNKKTIMLIVIGFALAVMTYTIIYRVENTVQFNSVSACQGLSIGDVFKKESMPDSIIQENIINGVRCFYYHAPSGVSSPIMVCVDNSNVIVEKLCDDES